MLRPCGYDQARFHSKYTNIKGQILEIAASFCIILLYFSYFCVEIPGGGRTAETCNMIL
jgi:hypothetical protein